MAKNSTAAITSSKRPSKPIRLPPAQRRQSILDEAISYFAEAGFDGSTRELARRAGVQQPLIYRYFPSKEDLIREVYETVYLSRWQRDWEKSICNREVPIRDRLIEFYSTYAEFQFEPSWIRIYLFSGLKGLDINNRYVTFMETQVLNRVCDEIRAAFGLPSVDVVPLQPKELAAFWVFHGGIFYYAVRREVYQVPVHVDVDTFTEVSVDSLLHGFPSMVREILSDAELQPSEDALDGTKKGAMR